MLRHLLLIGDVHAETTRLGHLLARARATAPDAILCVGDIVDGAEDAAACVAQLAEHGVVTVRGNHERWYLDDRALATPPLPAAEHAWLAALPATRHLDTVAGPLLLCHGVGADDMQRLRPDDEGYALASNFALEELVADGVYRWFVGGHTHEPMVRRFGALTVLNPGTLCRDNAPGALEVDLGRGRGIWLRVELDGVTALRSFELALGSP
ncbi:MAG: metallophosphoesterase family protein [Myxococcales bacterium]|nr:metallophosphoesterase family protein [Myxococcales bacterium]